MKWFVHCIYVYKNMWYASHWAHLYSIIHQPDQPEKPPRRNGVMSKNGAAWPDVSLFGIIIHRQFGSDFSPSLGGNNHFWLDTGHYNRSKLLRESHEPKSNVHIIPNLQNYEGVKRWFPSHLLKFHNTSPPRETFEILSVALLPKITPPE